jgi:hypothetical protein
VRCVLLVLIAACSHRSEPVAKSEPPKPAPAPVVVDHAPPVHVDDTPHAAPANPNPRGAHAIAVTLRSTPAGATAAVDGTPVGTTPAYWGGDADGHEHEFTFELRGYALARYRFVPITSGVVHARLEPIAEETDAGVSPETAVPAAGAMLVNPPPAVPADAYVAPPPPIVPPDVVAPVPIDAAAAGAPPMGPQP